MATTEFLKLPLTGTSDADLDQTFLEYRQKINGEGNDSAMALIDAFCRSINTKIGTFENTLSGYAGMITSINQKTATNGAITLTASDVGARADSWMPTASDVGAVPILRTINGHALSQDITITATDVGARPDSWMPTASDVGARPNTWTPTASDVGAIPTTRQINGKPLSEDVTLTYGDVGAAAVDHSHTLSSLGAAPSNHTHDALANIDQDVRTTASPTFDTVTANKVIGAVYQ